MSNTQRSPPDQVIKTVEADICSDCFSHNLKSRHPRNKILYPVKKGVVKYEYCLKLDKTPIIDTVYYICNIVLFRLFCFSGQKVKNNANISLKYYCFVNAENIQPSAGAFTRQQPQLLANRVVQ